MQRPSFKYNQEYVKTKFYDSVFGLAERGVLEQLKALCDERYKTDGYPPHDTLQQKDEVLGVVALHHAAEYGHLDVVEYILDQGVDAAPGDKNMVTPLHLAALNGHLDVCTALVKAGASPRLLDKDGDSPLHWASTKGNIEVLELLLNSGGYIDNQNTTGWTCLHRAAYCGRAEACKFLVKKNAGINGINQDGNSALHLAARNNQIGTVLALLEKGANPNLTNKDGIFAKDMTSSESIKDMLLNKDMVKKLYSQGLQGKRTNNKPDQTRQNINKVKSLAATLSLGKTSMVERPAREEREIFPIPEDVTLTPTIKEKQRLTQELSKRQSFSYHSDGTKASQSGFLDTALESTAFDKRPVPDKSVDFSMNSGLALTINQSITSIGQDSQRKIPSYQSIGMFSEIGKGPDTSDLKPWNKGVDSSSGSDYKQQIKQLNKDFKKIDSIKKPRKQISQNDRFLSKYGISSKGLFGN